MAGKQHLNVSKALTVSFGGRKKKRERAGTGESVVKIRERDKEEDAKGLAACSHISTSTFPPPLFTLFHSFIHPASQPASQPAGVGTFSLPIPVLTGCNSKFVLIAQLPEFV